MNKTKKPRIRFKGFTDDWEQRKLGDIATFINGRAYSQTELLDEGKYRVLRVGNFYTNDSWYYSNIELPERYYANDGDLLYTWSATFGPHIWHGEKVIYHYHIWKIELANTGKKHFMVQLLDRDKEALLAGHNGSTMIHITKSGMEQKHVMIPVDATEQDKIGVFFTYLDKTITLHQRKCEKLKIIKKSMIENCFPKNGQKVPKIRFSGFTGDWEQRKLGHIVGRVTRKNKDLVSNLPLTISAQYGLIDQNEFFDKRIASKDVSNYYLIHKGEFAYNKSTSTDAPWGAIKRLDRYENGVLSTLYIIFRILDENQVDSDYLASYYNTALWYKSIRMIAAEGARNHGLLNIAPDDFFETTLMIPRDIAEQKKIGAYLKNLDDLITLHQRKLNLWKFCKNRSKVMDDFDKEVDFEAALITALQRYGWGQDVIKYPTEKELIQNWANILFENNRSIDRLGDFPLVQEEIDDLLEQINRLRTPLALNGFINGKTVSITRKNPKDTLHYGKEVSLKIYDRMEIAAGQSRYQIVQQPRFARHEKVLQDRRGDLMLLINGMPVFHIELKKSGVPVIEAANQIEKYAHEGLFTGFFSLIQIFVAMNPTETLYFSNPGPDGRFNPDFYFHCADLNNDPINDWKRVAELLLSIPMAHQLVGFYTVADDADGVLKVMRSYQYYAANRISDRVAKHDWEEGNQLGGYIWHTTGSGKTMTSFKSAQLIAASKDADKVVFLMDRIELGTQSLKEYRAFADNADDVQETEDTVTLISKMKSNDPKNTLIVSSIQKMSNIKDDAEVSMKAKDLEAMKSKRLVFIIDECHRSTFGEMLSTIKATFPHALFFGFTGTPVFRENEKSYDDDG